MDILLIGASHHTASIEIREQLAFTPNMLRAALTHFDQTHKQGRLLGVNEGVILSTCNRLEVYTLVQDREIAQEALVEFLSQSCTIPVDELTGYLYTRQNQEAVQHLMRVACGLDSMVLGEPQILGQITDAYEAALSQGAAGTVLSALFRAAIHAGKRARTETAISINPSSISSVAAGLAAQLLGDLSGQHALLIGAGEMGTIAVRALLRRGITQVTVANRTYENAQSLAEEWSGKAITFQQLPESMAQADIIISSTGAPHTILDRDLLAPSMVMRSNRPLFIIDIAVPRDVDPNVTELSNVHLRDIDDLQGQVDNNVQERESEIPRVEGIVEQEAIQFLDWLASLDVVSTITDFRQWAEALRQNELQRLFNRLDLGEREQALIATMSYRLMNKMLHEPTLRLKSEAANGNGVAYVTALRHLFSLDTPEMVDEPHLVIRRNGKF